MRTLSIVVSSLVITNLSLYSAVDGRILLFSALYFIFFVVVFKSK